MESGSGKPQADVGKRSRKFGMGSAAGEQTDYGRPGVAVSLEAIPGTQQVLIPQPKQPNVTGPLRECCSAVTEPLPLDEQQASAARLGASQEREEKGGQCPQYPECAPYRQVKVVESSRSRSCFQCSISRESCDNEWPCHVCFRKGLRCVQLRSGDDNNAFAQYGNTSSCPNHCRCISTCTRTINQ